MSERAAGAFLKTRVARRLFLLFVLSAFLPLAAIAVLSFTQVRSLLLQQGGQRLAATAKAYGMGVFDRLNFAAEIARSAEHRAGQPLVQRAFAGVARIDGDGQLVPIVGSGTMPPLTREARSRLEEGKPAVLLGGEGPQVFIAAPSSRRAGGHVIGQLRPAYLWGPMDELPAATEFCIIEEGTRRLLHCNAPGGEGMLRAFAASAAGGAQSAVWDRDGEAHRAQSWAQFMGAGFGTPDWVVVASQPESIHIDRLLEFRQLYIPVVLLALLLVAWFTIRQSRNIVEPVAQLADRARGIAENDFQTRLDLRRDDEFGALGDAIDNMSERLGRQFASLTTLAEIDNLILTTQDTTQVIRTVVQRLGDVVPADLITLTLFDHDDRREARTYFFVGGPGGGFLMDRERIAADALGALQQEPEGRWVGIAAEGPVPSYLLRPRTDGMASALVQPIAWRGTVSGVIVLGYRPGSVPSDEERQRAREIADRVAVAVSSAWRDEQLYKQAHFDPLTGAPNRLLFADRLAIEIARSRRGGETFALLFIDLDRFKNVNDSYGHSVGDRVLREAAQRIARCVRASDTVSRLGGDEFTVMLTHLNDPQEAWLIAESIVEALSLEFVIGDLRCFLSASVGIASYPADGATAEALLKSADTAMYRAKAAGRAQVVFFEERMNAEALARLTLDRDLRGAIERGELVMHYQPKLDLASGRICGAEALVRWKHPEKGLISPVRFIPLAEESGYIERLGQWTLEQACQQMKRWRAEGVRIDHVAVNVSPRQFRRRTLVDFVARCVEESGLPAHCLQLEVTEGLLLDTGEGVEDTLRALAAAGHGIALDDFGTGFSSMSYLKRFPVSTIKIDRVFVDGLEAGGDSEAIVAAIIAMSHALGKSVIAEGVESGEQVAILRRLRCDEIQGFHLSKGLEPAEFADFVRARSEQPATA